MSQLDSAKFVDLSGTGMSVELRPSWGVRAGMPDIVGGTLLVDGKEIETFAINDDGLWVDSSGFIFKESDFSRYVIRAMNEMRSKRALERGKVGQ
jgi:hypothetical protein